MVAIPSKPMVESRNDTNITSTSSYEDTVIDNRIAKHPQHPQQLIFFI